MKKYCSRAYWDNYIGSIIDSIKEDKDTIIDLIMYGKLESADIIMRLSTDSNPSYQIKVNKIAEKSPFGEDEEE